MGSKIKNIFDNNASLHGILQMAHYVSYACHGQINFVKIKALFISLNPPWLGLTEFWGEYSLSV